jgi:hypothetical protein
LYTATGGSRSCVSSSAGTTTLTRTTHRTAGRVALRLTVTDQHGSGRAGQTVAGLIVVTGVGPQQQLRFPPTDPAGQSTVTLPLTPRAATVQVRVTLRRGRASVVLTTVLGSEDAVLPRRRTRSNHDH